MNPIEAILDEISVVGMNNLNEMFGDELVIEAGEKGIVGHYFMGGYCED